MDLEERIVAGVLGAIWGSVLGFLFALLVSYQTQRFYSSGFLRSDWVSTVSGFEVFFGVIGLLLQGFRRNPDRLADELGMGNHHARP
jgi:hypothetical protein